ncbi:MAG TPA: hypothetical protein VM535_01960, partial [Candidatus Saccharimonadales bacterium]|nr:hypothetical protein [Candidatus Saccharimonadales bacterium]
MFEKLLSQLPYNPGLVQQMSFYSRRMREEASIRRVGMVFIVLAFMVQFFAVLSPPKSTVASSDNDLISGGIGSAGDAARHCRNNSRGFGGILDTYGITCQQVANAQTVRLNSGAHNGDLFSMGHLAYGKAGETPVDINGKRLYWRYLSSWGQANYQALKLNASSGKLFYILYSCGNLVSVGLPSPYTPQTGIGGNHPVSPPPQIGIGNNQPVTKPVTAPASPTPPPTPPPNTPCPYDSSITADNSSCKPCDQSVSSQDATACVSIHKTAANATQ